MDNQTEISTNNVGASRFTNFELKDLIRIVLVGKWWICLSILIFFILSAYISLSKVPKYKSYVNILLEQDQNSFTLNYYNTSDSDIANEMRIIKSRKLAQNVIKELWASNKEKRKYMYIFGSRKFRPFGQRIRQPLNSFFNSVSNKELSDLSFFDNDYNDDIGTRFSGALSGNLTVSHKRGTNFLIISYSSPYPEEAALIVNAIAKVYKQMDYSWEANKTSNLEVFLVSQISDKELELKKSEELLKEFKEQNQMFDLEQNSTLLLSKVVDSDSDFQENRAEINIVVNQKEYIKNSEGNYIKVELNDIKNNISQL